MRVRALPESVSRLGTRGAALYWVQRIRGELANDTRPLTLTAKEASHPLVWRANTSDRGVFHQIFLQREYACVADLSDVGLVIDCGANVGYSSAYFLTCFPNCHVIAVEPDPANYKVLERNIEPYGSRVTILNTAVWTSPVGLKLVDTYRDRQAWATQVREVTLGETPDLHAVDIGTLLRESDYDRISLLKVDIEGAEAVVFANPPWINLVDNIVIELHDDSAFGDATAIFREAIAGEGFTVQQLRERTICRR